jgi:Ca2+-binding EF-hand superfamily protein
MGNNKS